jgi:hypothetical protein
VEAGRATVIGFTEAEYWLTAMPAAALLEAFRSRRPDLAAAYPEHVTARVPWAPIDLRDTSRFVVGR